jgi:flagellar hook assembly protein FlgD
LYRVGRFGLQIFNSAGEKVRTLGDWEVQNPTEVTVAWDGRNERHELVGSGVYVIYFREPEHARTAKVLVIR